MHRSASMRIAAQCPSDDLLAGSAGLAGRLLRIPWMNLEAMELSR